MRPQRRLAIKMILRWADAYFQSSGEWPIPQSGPIPVSHGDTWMSIDGALIHGRRGLRGGQTLRRFLARHRGRPYRVKCPDITRAQIIRWARAHHRRTGRWPVRDSGPIVGGYTGDTWHKIDNALRNGCRSLRAGSSLSRLLKRRCGVRPKYDVPKLSVKQVITWARKHSRRTGRWPSQSSGTIQDANHHVTWTAIHMALTQGHRGLPGNMTLSKLLQRELGVRPSFHPVRLTATKILNWADQHHRRTGHWPDMHSGPVFGIKRLTWGAINSALRYGHYGMPGESSLARFLRKHKRLKRRN